jgi:malonate-semialdehyde dehydrogenase (acetylating)/methylmalonate-semialdehyde dehydrogenase
MNTRDAALAKVRELAHFIGGKQVRGESGGRFGEVFNPTTGALSGKVPLAKAEVERAIAVARRPLPDGRNFASHAGE